MRRTNINVTYEEWEKKESLGVQWRDILKMGFKYAEENPEEIDKIRSVHLDKKYGRWQ